VVWPRPETGTWMQIDADRQPKMVRDMALKMGCLALPENKKPGISVAIKKVFHMGDFPFPKWNNYQKKKSICHGSKIWFQHVPTIKN